MRQILVVSSLLTLILFLCSCGGGSESPSFVPKPIPTKYQGMSVIELKSMSKTPSYKQLKDNIDHYEGELVWFDGEVYQNFEGSVPNTYQIYVFVTPLEGPERYEWTEQILLLHSLERGPELPEGKKVRVSGIVTGLHVQPLKIVYTNEIVAPIISVIKAALITDSN